MRGFLGRFGARQTGDGGRGGGNGRTIPSEHNATTLPQHGNNIARTFGVSWRVTEERVGVTAIAECTAEAHVIRSIQSLCLERMAIT